MQSTPGGLRNSDKVANHMSHFEESENRTRWINDLAVSLEKRILQSSDGPRPEDRLMQKILKIAMKIG
jgi:hypothetical protein